MAEISKRFVSRSWSQVVSQGSEIPLIEIFLILPPEIRKKILDETDLIDAAKLAYSCRQMFQLYGYKYVYPRKEADEIGKWFSQAVLLRACRYATSLYFNWFFSVPDNRISDKDLAWIIKDGDLPLIKRAVKVCQDGNHYPSAHAILQQDSRMFEVLLGDPNFSKIFDSQQDPICEELIAARRSSDLELFLKKPRKPENEDRFLRFLHLELFLRIHPIWVSFLLTGKVPLPLHIFPEILAISFHHSSIAMSYIREHFISTHGLPMVLPGRYYLNYPHGENTKEEIIARKYGYFWNDKKGVWERNAWKIRPKRI